MYSTVEGQTAPGSIEDYLKTAISRYLREGTAKRVANLSAGVWRIDLDSGESAVAKLHPFERLARDRPYSFLRVEHALLRLLNGRGCCVPRCYGVDVEHDLVFYELVGECTLDDMAQKDAAAARCYAEQAVTGLARIDAVLNHSWDEIGDLLNPFATEGALKSGWISARDEAFDGLEFIMSRQGRAERKSNRVQAIDDLRSLWKSCADAEPDLGVTDYNARNIVVDPSRHRVTFIEFAKIGWDWTERRLVQYLTSLGSRRWDGTVVSLLNRDTVERFSRGCDRKGRNRAHFVDRHELIFLLIMLIRLASALEGGGEKDAARIRKVWKNPSERLREIMELLARPLSDDPLASRLRGRMGGN